MQALEKLFGGTHRIKLLRFFLLHRDRVVSKEELSKTLHISVKQIVKEGRFLRNAGIVKERSCFVEVIKGKKVKKLRTIGFAIDTTFPFLQPLHNLLITAAPVSRVQMQKFFKNKRAVVMVVLAGVFLDENVQKEKRPDIETPIDILIVAEKGKKADYDAFVSRLGSEVGKELDWAFFTTQEFEYRQGIQDKFLRDIFDYSHEILINRFIP